EGAGGREEDHEGGQQPADRPGGGGGQRGGDEAEAARQDRTAAALPRAGQHADRQLDQAARQQRHRGQQADLAVAEAQIAPDQRQRGALHAVYELVGKLDRQRGRYGGPRGRAGRYVTSQSRTAQMRDASSRAGRAVCRRLPDMFTISERDSLRARLIERARADQRIAAGALTGSAALGTADRWSDIDLAFGVAERASLAEVLADYTAWM